MTESDQQKKSRVTFAALALIALGLLLNQILASGPAVPGLVWNFHSHSVFIIMPLLALFLGLGSAEQYGLVLRCKEQHFWFGLAAFCVYAALPLTSEALFGHFDIQSRLAGNLAQAMLFYLVFAAFGEELFFRGFMQSSLNRLCGRKKRFSGIPYGPGLYVTALIFGFGHCISGSIFTGALELNWGALLPVTAAGLLLGLAREKSGTLLLPVLLHYGMNFYITTFENSVAGSVGLILAYAIVAIGLFTLTEDAKVLQCNHVSQTHQ